MFLRQIALAGLNNVFAANSAGRAEYYFCIVKISKNSTFRGLTGAEYYFCIEIMSKNSIILEVSQFLLLFFRQVREQK